MVVEILMKSSYSSLMGIGKALNVASQSQRSLNNNSDKGLRVSEAAMTILLTVNAAHLS